MLAIASNAGAAMVVNEISGTFGAIGLDSGDPASFELTGGTVSQPAAGGSLEILDIGVDLTGYASSGDSVLVDGSTVAIWNPTNGTIATFDVDSATLTQILIDPLGIGYMELDLTRNINNLATDADDPIVLPLTMQMLITYNGLAIETDGSNGIAGLNMYGSASFSAVPEPASLALLLGGFVFLRKRKNQVSVR
ncbi:MAG: hypothetical protein DRP66_10680 [Planctomycetota bacterium]|nr:MAG: hypothetical protein DRP66_10680 [Planctomycetota bacterium]